MFPITDQHLQAIGRITVTFASLEHAVSFFVWQLLKVDQPVGEVITEEISFSKRVTLLLSLFRLQCNNPDKVKEFQKILGKACEAEQSRNRLTHSVWFWGNTAGTITRMKTTAKHKDGLKLQIEEMSCDDINKVAEQIDEATYQLQYFMVGYLQPQLISSSE